MEGCTSACNTLSHGIGCPWRTTVNPFRVPVISDWHAGYDAGYQAGLAAALGKIQPPFTIVVDPTMKPDEFVLDAEAGPIRVKGVSFEP
jgi:hypothetical protein